MRTLLYRAKLTTSAVMAVCVPLLLAQAASAQQQVKIQAVKAGLRVEMARINRQTQNIRPFFDTDENTDLWSTGR